MNTPKPNLDDFTRAYIEALYFTGAGPDSEELTTESDFAPKTLAKIVSDCARFQELADDKITGCERRYGAHTVAEYAGFDFWLTRNGHGAGFWDGGWPEHGDALTAIAEQFGESCAYLGADGMIYVSP